jgi:adenine-specific DNA-methyltransferase
LNLIKELKKITLRHDNNIQLVKFIVSQYSEYYYNYKFKINLTNKELFNSQIIEIELKNVFNRTDKNYKAVNLGLLYESIIPSNFKKELGQVFTPYETINNMIEASLKEETYLYNPYIKILDPSCGCGYFLTEFYKKLISIFNKNSVYFEDKYGINQNNISKHIIKNNLYGCEIDSFTQEIAIANIFFESGINSFENIFNEDFLFSDIKHNFDIIIGNPPYIGHKKLSSEYKKELKSSFDVYSDKGDISYCFFEKGYSMLKPDGILSFITSRYFAEASNAQMLREFISSKYRIEQIIDFKGTNHFKNTGVSPLIIKLVKSPLIDFIKVFDISKNESFTLEQKKVSSTSWKLVNNKILALHEKILSLSENNVKDYFEINQGIITGCDKAFIVDESIICEYNLERDLLVDWIKGSSLKGTHIDKSKSLKLIYTNNYNLDDFPNTKKYLEIFKEKLSKRRECIKGYRRWYDLQWGREQELFNRTKILFPYKSSSNKFTLDTQKYYFSADIYMMSAKKRNFNFSNSIYYLNSIIFEFLVKSTSKKIGKNNYEYYPYNIETLPYFDIKDFQPNNELDLNSNIHNFNNIILKCLNISTKELNTIKNFINID